jgi:hypothetical protein
LPLYGRKNLILRDFSTRRTPVNIQRR